MKLSVFWKRLFTPQNCFFLGGGISPLKRGSNINGTPKGHTLARDRVVWAIKRENLSTGLTCRRVPEKGIKIVIFHAFAQKPPWADLHQIWHSRRGRRLNDLYQFFGDRLRGVDSVGGGVENCHHPLRRPVAVNTGCIVTHSRSSRTVLWHTGLQRQSNWR